jgi:hypothetical protein
MTDIAVSKTAAPGDTAPATETNGEAKVNPLSLAVGTIIHPTATFRQLRDAKHSYWWFVLAVTALMVVVLALASSSVQARAFQTFSNRAGGANAGASNAGAATGGGATGGGAGTTRQFQQASPLILIGLPVAGGIIVTLLDYGLRALTAFLMSMLMGGKAAFKEVFRMAAWTTLPAAIRRVVQSIAVVATGGQVAAGLSAAMTTAESRALPLLSLLLSYVDIYTVWSVLLLGIGMAITGKLSKGKSAVGVFVYLGLSVVGILIYFAISNALGGVLGGGTGGVRGVRVTQPAQ